MKFTLKKDAIWLKATLQRDDEPVQTLLRILAATVGGYILTYSSLGALALLLPWPRVDIVFFSALFPSLIWLGTFLWAFSAPTAQRAWRNILRATVFCTILAIAKVWI